MLIGNLIPWRSKARDSHLEAGSESPVNRLHAEMDRLLDRFFSEPFTGEGGLAPGRWRPFGQPWAPSIDVSESADEITVSAEIPGVDPKDIDVSLTGDVLTIAGEKQEAAESGSEGYYRAERRFGAFRRGIPLPAAVDPEKISAEYQSGVLKVRLRKSEKRSAKRIPVSVSRK